MCKNLCKLRDGQISASQPFISKMPKKKKTARDEIYESLRGIQFSPRLLRDIEEDVTRLFDPNYHQNRVHRDDALAGARDDALAGARDDIPEGAAFGPVQNRQGSAPKIGMRASEMVQNFSLDLQNYLDAFDERIRTLHVEQHEFLMIDALSQVCEKYKEEKTRNEALERKIETLTKSMEIMCAKNAEDTQVGVKETKETKTSQTKKSNKLSNIRKRLREGKINQASYNFILSDCNTAIVKKNMVVAIKAFCVVNGIDMGDDATFEEAVRVLKTHLDNV